MRINEAAAEIGVSAITLKRWFLSKKVEEVGRDRNGWRVFTQEDIQRLKSYAAQDTEKCSSAQHEYAVASFFSGIGGFDIGFEKLGFSIKMQCEIEPFCNIVLKKHWPHVPKHGDIRGLDETAIPSADVWVGGFPCQDLSLARMGKRDGLRGSKSGLFYEFARLVGECKPRVILLENVAGLLSSHSGRDFGIVISTLAKLGYAVGWRTFNSKYFGVPQSRQRVYIVGCRGDGKGPGEILFEPKCSERDYTSGRQNGQKVASAFQSIIGDPCGEGPVIQAIAYCLYATSARHTGTDWSRNYVCYPKLGMIRRLTPAECEGVMSFPSGWTLVNDSGLSSEDLDSARYHALGNAVTPPVAEWLAYRIKLYLNSSVHHEKSQLKVADKVQELKTA